MLQLLSELRHKVAIGYVGGSNMAKQQEQIGTGASGVDVTQLFDFCFAENGLTAYRMGEQLAGASFIGWIGEEKYKELVKWYADLPFLGTASRVLDAAISSAERQLKQRSCLDWTPWR
jgi:hypothetical protein